MKLKTVEIGGVPVGEEHPVRIFAEIGTYFGKEMELAKEYIDIAKQAGCEFLKSEVLHDLSIIHDDQMTHTFMTDEGAKTEIYRDLLKRKCNSLEEYEKIFKYAMQQGMPVVASVYDAAGVDFLVSIGASAVKVASLNITNRPLIEHCAQSGLPLIMDTGSAYLHEIAQAVHWAESNGVKGIILNHRPDGSPCPADKHNLHILKRMLETFGWPVGLSCHYDGEELIYLAIGLGARIIEKPMYHKKERDDQDTMYVLTFDEFKTMVQRVRNCSAALGDYERTYIKPEQLTKRSCIVAKNEIKVGGRLSRDNVRFAWPMKGIPVQMWPDVEGLSVAKDVEEGKPIQWADLGDH